MRTVAPELTYEEAVSICGSLDALRIMLARRGREGSEEYDRIERAYYKVFNASIVAFPDLENENEALPY